MNNPEVRASDADRDRVAEALRENYAQGRLDNEELQERLESAYRARTLADLVPLTRDLPASDLGAVGKDVERQRGGGTVARADRSILRHPAVVIPWTVWAGVNLINVSVWGVLTMTLGISLHPWWIWSLIPGGIGVAIGTVLFVVLSGSVGNKTPEGNQGT